MADPAVEVLYIEDAMWGHVFTFAKAGDELAVHTHTEEHNHISIVTFGTVELMGRPEIEGLVFESKPGGTIIDWAPHKPHGYRARSDGATLVNILKR